jgi:hypothetical protein
MKNVFKFLGIIALVAVIGFSMAACGDGDGGGGGGGGLTITGIPANLNGKYAIAAPMTGSIIAAAEVTQNSAKGGKISGGSVKLKVFNPQDGSAYTGNDTVASLMVMIYDEESINEDIDEPVAVGMISSVTFTKGVGSGAYTDLPF